MFLCCERGGEVLCSHSNGILYRCICEDKNMLFSRVKIWCFRGKAHLVFYWCLYNNQYILYLVLLGGLFCISFCFKRERIEQDFTPWQINITFMRFYGYFSRSSRKSPVNKSAAKINPDKHEHEFCNYNCWERQPPYLYFGSLLLLFLFHSLHSKSILVLFDIIPSLKQDA